MEQLLAEAGESIDLKKKSKKGKKLVQNNDMNAPQPQYLHSLITPENMLRDQIEAAMLTDTLIDELRQLEDQGQSDAKTLQQQCDSLLKHSSTLDTQKKQLEIKLTELSKDNDSLKAKFSSLLDQF